MRAAAEQHVGGALGDDGELAGAGRVRLQAGHDAPLGGERDLAHPLEPVGPAVAGAELDLGHQEGGLGGVALDRPLVALLAQGGVVGQAASAQHQGGLAPAEAVLLQPLPGILHLPLGAVADPGHGDLAGGGDHAPDRHLASGEGAGLVGADDRRRAEGLDRGELLDDGVVRGHPLHAQGQHDRQDRRQPLGHRRDGQGDAEQQGGDHVVGAVHPEHRKHGEHHHGRDHHHRDAEHPADERDLPLQRRRVLPGAVQQVGDLAHLGGHAGAGHHRPAHALRDGGAVVHHVEPVAQGDVPGQGAGVLEHGLALTGERGLGDLERRRRQQPRVSGHRVALAEGEQVTRHELAGRHPQRYAVAHDRSGGGGHLLQGLDGVLGPGLLHVAQHGVEHDDHRDDDGVVGDAVRALEPPRAERDDDGHQEQIDQRVTEVLQDLAPGGHRRLADDLVGPHGLQPPGCLGRRQTTGRVGAQPLRHGRCVQEPRVGHSLSGPSATWPGMA